MQTTRQCSAAAVEVSVCGPQQAAQSKLTRCSSSLSLYGNHRGWHVWDASWQHGHCSRRHLASLHLVAELSRSPLARTPQTQARAKHSCCLRCRLLTARELGPSCLGCTPASDKPSISGRALPDSEVHQRHVQHEHQAPNPTHGRENSAASDGAMGRTGLSLGPQQQASELSDFILI